MSEMTAVPPGPCSVCGKETTGGFRQYGGGWTYRCADCPQPRQVRPHTPGWPGLGGDKR